MVIMATLYQLMNQYTTIPTYDLLQTPLILALRAYDRPFYRYGGHFEVLTHWPLCCLQPPVMSLGLSSTSDVITFDQNWRHLNSTSAAGKYLSNDTQIRVINSVNGVRNNHAWKRSLPYGVLLLIYTLVVAGFLSFSCWYYLLQATFKTDVTLK